MDTLHFLIYLFPILMIIHDFEEIIFFKPWMDKNRTKMEERSPILMKYLNRNFKDLSPSSFSFAVLVEFVITCLCLFLVIYKHYYWLWLIIFMSFSAHLLTHLFYWLLYRRYTPSIITSFLILPYIVIVVIYMLRNDIFSVAEVILGFFLGTMVLFITQMIYHKIAYAFHCWVHKS